MTDMLENQITRLDEALSDVEKQAKAVLKRVQSLRKRAADGDIAQTAGALAQMPALATQLAQAATDAQATLTYDLPAAMADGRYLQELQSTASARNVVLTERDGRLSAFPVMLRLEPKLAGVRVGRKLERRVRPSVLLDMLRKAQATSRFDAARFLGQLAGAYAILARIAQPGWERQRVGTGPVVALADIYELLTMLPAAAADYPREEFACDLLRLDRLPDTSTKDGLRFTLPASTGSKGSKRLSIFDETGEERIFVGLRFTRDPGEVGNGDPA